MTEIDPAAFSTHRPTLRGSRQAVSSGHYLASAAAFSILDAGGNAVDAGCAAGIALGVLCPDEVNVAGVAPIMIRTADGRIATIAGVGHWPQSIPPDLFLRDYDGQIPPGILPTVVPAAPDAWITALRDFGTLSFAEVAESAIRFARDGFEVHERLAQQIELQAGGYRRWPANADIYLPGGSLPRARDRFVQRDLANSLQYMADEESAARGDRAAGLEAARSAFYAGDIAAQIVSYHEAHGGYLTRDDLANFRCRYEPPLRTRWRDFDIVTCGPWCQGPLFAQIMRLVGASEVLTFPFLSTDYVHLMLEIFKAAFADREYRYGDPRFVDVGMDELLSDDHVAARLAMIDPEKAAPEMPPPIGGDPGVVDYVPAPRHPVVGGAHGDTSYVCVVDRWGNSFSAVPSDASSGSPVIPGTGLIPSERGIQSRPDPRHPSGVAPGKRPRLTPNPAMAIRDDGSVLTIGCPGGDMQVQAMVQVFLNTFHFGMDLQLAIDAPRFSTWSFPNSFAPFDYPAGLACIESRVPGDVLDALADRGHIVERWPDFTRTAAAVEAIYSDAQSGFLAAGADPRQPAYAIVS